MDLIAEGVKRQLIRQARATELVLEQAGDAL